ncbi:MAG: amidase family protein [Candidatus Nanoarchaeia archaeon]
MKLKEKVKQIKQGKLTAVENVMQFGKKIEDSKHLNIFLTRNEDALEQAKAIDEKIKKGEKTGKLAGLCVAVKSNICVQGMPASCASHVLEDVTAAYNATVINKLLAEDVIILGMVNMDEFACGGSGETSAFKPTKNPIQEELIPGGSSSGSAAAVSASLCDFALGTDTGGSIRNPSSHCAVTGLKPTYASVSRYGLIDMTMSLDVIGPITKYVDDSKLIFNIIKGQDNLDASSIDSKPEKRDIKTIGLVNVQDYCQDNISKLVEDKVKTIAKKKNWQIKTVNLPLEIALETYYILVYVEFFSATRKFDSRKYGLDIDKEAGPEVIRRILGGKEISKAEYAGRYYNHALKAKEYIKQAFNKLFKDVDLLVLPVVPKLPHKLSKKISLEEMYNYDRLTVPASLAGLPAIAIPAGKIKEDNLDKPVGLQLIAPHHQEDMLFKAGEQFE